MRTCEKNLLNNKNYFVNVSVKDEADDSDNLAALPDFKDEDLKPFGDACNDFPNGKFINFFIFSTFLLVCNFLNLKIEKSFKL